MGEKNTPTVLKGCGVKMPEKRPLEGCHWYNSGRPRSQNNRLQDLIHTETLNLKGEYNMTIKLLRTKGNLFTET